MQIKMSCFDVLTLKVLIDCGTMFINTVIFNGITLHSQPTGYA